MHIGQDGKLPNDSIGIEDAKVETKDGPSPWGLTWNAVANKWESCSGYDNHPVIYVTWFGAVAYCDWLNTKRQGLTFKLPTEAQWQNAAQCGTQYVYEGLSNIWNNDFGWVGTSGNPTHEVCTALKGKSPWNLNDICGNVWEWCNDWYGTTYPAPTAIDPTGASETKVRRVRHGGCCTYTAASAMATNRDNAMAPAYCSNACGFRVCAMAN
jgi:formylglycine-generating enzyme required for sulfatase activity